MSARVFAVSDKHISPASVAQLAASLRSADGTAPVEIDLRAVESAAPEAVAALIELGRSQAGMREVSLSGLSRGLTLCAVQAGLAERFTILASATKARAVIYEVPGAIGAGALDIAGESLLVRQLQWLRDQGIEDVVVELAIGNASDQRADVLLRGDPLSARCTVVPSRSALGPDALAERAGLDRTQLFVAIPADTLVNGPLAIGESPQSLCYAAPTFASQALPRVLQLRSRVSQAPANDVMADGWALAIADPGAAHTLSCAVLAGLVTDILVHAAETKPGVWLARGARVAEDASLVAPILVGRNVRVFARAQLGPNVIIGADAVIERDVVMSEASVCADTLVGEGAHISNAQVDARGITSLAGQARIEVDDPLQLTRAIDRSAPPAVRALALLALVALAVPWVIGCSIYALLGRRMVRELAWRGHTLHLGDTGIALLDLIPALYDVINGRRDLLGVAAVRALELEGGRRDGPARAGALDVSELLAPGAATSTLLWMWRWYLLNKGFALDRRLLWPALRGSLKKRKNAGDLS